MGIVAPAADRLAELLRTTVGIEPPVRLRAWDGSEAGPADGPVLVVRSRRALRRLLWRPGELGLAPAYVTGDIDVEGDLTDGLRRAWLPARSHPAAATSRRGRMMAALRAVPLGAGRPAAPNSGQRGAAVRPAAHEEFARVWRLYLAGGRLAFEEGRMGVDQILAAKTPSDGR
jgi:cyclopropane-fatty-acyl-phospholipid synthase